MSPLLALTQSVGVPFVAPLLAGPENGCPLLAFPLLAFLSCKPGAGDCAAAMLALQIEIREAGQCGKVTPEQIPGVYRNRLAEIRATDGVLVAQPKQVPGSGFGNVIPTATLSVNRDKPNPVVLYDARCTV